MTGWCPYDGEDCRHDGYCKECSIYLTKKGCDRCGKPIKKYIPLNAIPTWCKKSLPFELKVPTEESIPLMKMAELCMDCVESFCDWWEEGGEK